MSALPKCPTCQSEYTYKDGENYICPECAHEWSAQAEEGAVESGLIVKDANGNVLQDGDAVSE